MIINSKARSKKLLCKHNLKIKANLSTLLDKAYIKFRMSSVQIILNFLSM